jgi:hypothetical protein
MVSAHHFKGFPGLLPYFGSITMSINGKVAATGRMPANDA